MNKQKYLLKNSINLIGINWKIELIFTSSILKKKFPK